MELVTAIIIVSILSLMVYSAYSVLAAKAARGRCETNLRSLYTAAQSYVIDHNQWPQVVVTDIEDSTYAEDWINALSPYKLGQENWICPTVQKVLGNPSLKDDLRIDYIPAPFDAKPNTPYQYPNHPWFMERGDMHGTGNLLIFTNGNIRSLDEVKRDSGTINLD
jgi:type II secretory pathway pseudopilin PulG